MARMTDPAVICEIKAAVAIPVMAKVRIGHFMEAGSWRPSRSTISTRARCSPLRMNPAILTARLLHTFRMRMPRPRRGTEEDIRRRKHDPDQGRSRDRERSGSGTAYEHRHAAAFPHSVCKRRGADIICQGMGLPPGAPSGSEVFRRAPGSQLCRWRHSNTADPPS